MTVYQTAQSRPGLLNCETALLGRFGDRTCSVAKIVLELGEPRLSRSRRVSALYGRSTRRLHERRVDCTRREACNLRQLRASFLGRTIMPDGSRCWVGGN